MAHKNASLHSDMFDKSTSYESVTCLDLQKLQEKLNEMECELRSIRQAAQSQERTIHGLTESNGTKDREVSSSLCCTLKYEMKVQCEAIPVFDSACINDSF